MVELNVIVVMGKRSSLNIYTDTHDTHTIFGGTGTEYLEIIC